MSVESPQNAPSLVRLPPRQWVDLFYDLAFAAGIIAISGGYAGDVSASGALWFSIAYGLLWCTWLVTSSAAGSFVARGPATTVWSIALLVVQMGAVLLMAVSAGDSLDQSALGFDLLLGVALMIALILKFRSWPPGPRRLPAPPALLAAAIVALAASWFAGTVAGLALWCAALAAMAAAAWAVLSDPRIEVHRLADRMGELTIVVLGEILVKLALTLAGESVWSIRLLAFLPTLALLSACWWVYFAGLLPDGGPLALARLRVWVAAHLPLHLALLALAVGLAKLVVDSPTLANPGSPVSLLAVPLTLCFASFGALGYAVGSPSRRVLTWVTAGLVLLALVAGLRSVGALTVASVGAGLALAAAAVSAWRPRGVSIPPVGAGPP